MGYIEIGKEIDNILRELQTPSGVEVALSLNKKAMRLEDWEEGMRRMNRNSDLERLPHSVIIYESKGRLPDVFAQLLDHSPSAEHHEIRSWDIDNAGRNWSLTISPLNDSSGKEIGDILIMSDTTNLRASFKRDITLGGIVSAVILAALLGLSYVVLRHTDAGIRAQEARLRESREHLAATLRSIGDGVIACDTTGAVVSLNAAAEVLTGWSNAEAAGVSIREVFRIVNAQSRETAEIPVFRAIADGVNVDLANHTALIAKDGTEHQIADSCAPIKDSSGTVSGAVLVFRDVTEEYRQREELRESEERFKQLAEQSRTITWEFDSEGLYTFISPVVKEILGYAPEEIIGKMHFYDLHPKEGIEEIKKIAFGLFSRKEQFRELLRPSQSKSGEIRWFSTNGIPLLNPDGTLRGYRGSYTDITERRLMEEELESERTRLAGIIEATHVGTWEWNIQTGELVINERWADIIGYTLEEISPISIETWIKYCHPDDLKRCNEKLEKHFHEELPYYDVEVRMMHKNGGWVWVHDRGKVVSWTPEGKPLLMLGTHQDITARKQAEAAMQQQRDFLQMVIDINPHLIFAKDRAGRFTLINKAYARSYGTTVENLLGKTLEEVNFNKILADRYNKEDDDVITTGKELIIPEDRIVNNYGQTRWRSTVKRPLFDENGQVYQVLGVSTDITALKTTEQNLARALDTAQDANQFKTQLLANVSHDLRTPLNAIMGHTEMLQKGIHGPLTERQLKIAKRIITNTKNLTSMVNRLVDQARLEAGTLMLEVAPFAPASLLAQMHATMDILAETKHLQLTSAIADNVPDTLYGDFDQLMQILQNLVGNAIKFTDNGEVSVRLFCPSAYEWGLEVADTGPGIPPEAQSYIFEAFRQVDGTATRRHGGSGLGLSIVKQLVTMMAGSVYVHSQPGQGSTFRVILPKTTPEEKPND